MCHLPVFSKKSDRMKVHFCAFLVLVDRVDKEDGSFEIEQRDGNLSGYLSGLIDLRCDT